MLDPCKIRRIHFIGICGTGMASLAAMLQERGYEVAGSDEAAYPPMSEFLAAKGIGILQGFRSANLQPVPDLVVVGNAISRGNPEVEYLLNFKIPRTSFPAAVSDFFLRDRTSVVVTGTHGKTTTTSMIAWALQRAGREPGFLIGGIAENFQSSYGLGNGHLFVIEGDEYDSAFFDKGPKFLHYLPDLAVIGNVEFDHADIYPNLEAVCVQFRRFVNLIPERGFLAVGADSACAVEVSRGALCEKETFALEGEHDWSARDIRLEGERSCFDILHRGKLYCHVRLPLFGTFNVRNALAATAVLRRAGLSEDDIQEGLEEFRGVRRRLQFLGEIRNIRIYQDFAHHPTAVRETLKAVRAAFPRERLWAIYEPRSATSRRNVFQHEIAAALCEADCVVLPPLFKPEKVPEGDRLSLARLVADLRAAGRSVWNPDGVASIIDLVCAEARGGDVIVILSNGGFGGIFEKLPAALRQGAV
jgi:UDP-N-acetylmuramate: L-alanyl-gamma-D-glutamyl-meso-diaminopimelate ligase